MLTQESVFLGGNPLQRLSLCDLQGLDALDIDAPVSIIATHMNNQFLFEMQQIE
jgi:hypothetical protein